MECLDEVFSSSLRNTLLVFASSILVTSSGANCQKYPPGRHCERTHAAIGYTLQSWYITRQTGVGTAGEADDTAFFVVVDVDREPWAVRMVMLFFHWERTPLYRPPYPRIMV